MRDLLSEIVFFGIDQCGAQSGKALHGAGKGVEAVGSQPEISTLIDRLSR